MKVREEHLSCPKCKKEFINYNLPDSTRIDNCPDCAMYLLPSEDVEYFDNEEYIGTGQIIEEEDTYNIYLDVQTDISKFLEYNPKGKIILVPKIEKVHDSKYDVEEKDYYYLVGYLYIIGHTDSKRECLISKAKINWTYGDITDSKKKFIKEDLEYILKYRSELIYKSIDKEIKSKVSLRKRVK